MVFLIRIGFLELNFSVSVILLRFQPILELYFNYYTVFIYFTTNCTGFGCAYNLVCYPEKLLPKEKKSISKLGVPVSVLKKDEEEGNKNLQEGEGVSVNVDPDTVIGDRKIESIELKDLESNLGELDSNNETQASDGLLGQRGGTSSGIEPTVSTSDEIVFSSSPSVRILQR